MRTVVVAFLLALGAWATAEPTAVIGSKRFVESYVLGEIAVGLCREARIQAEHKQGMGGTAVLWEALKAGQITAYPEYTGTIAEEILKRPGASRQEMARELRSMGVLLGDDLGFNNTYAFVMTKVRARSLGISKVSDLAQHPGLRVALTPEFLERSDGWKAVAVRYGLTGLETKAVDHALGYQSLASGAADVKDAYSTDAQIADLDLALLVDDLGFFPSYRAVYLVRAERPDVMEALQKASGTLDESAMTALNSEATRTEDFAATAAKYLRSQGTKPTSDSKSASLVEQTLALGAQHLAMVGLSLALAVLVALPLGVAASRPGPVSHLILGACGVIQTLPSIAVLLFLIPVFGIGFAPAVAALFLYSLLPIVRNTAAGLQSVAPSLRESAEALGLSPWERLRFIEAPLASRTIVAGIKTAAVINVGTATLGAFIGAGGFGQPIVSGLALNSVPVMMQGAVPAAVLALLVQGAFEILERTVVPRGLRLKAR
jgi:osmoprotectant transport system permease protein